MAKKTGKLTVTPGLNIASQHGLFIIDDETLTDPRIRDLVFCPSVNGDVKGHGLVPRDYSIHPKEMFEPPANLPLIPRSEWSARVKAQEQNKSRISDILLAAGIPSLDQGPNGYCHDDRTDVLTDRGWVRWSDYNWSDSLGTVNPITGLMEFQSPTQRHVYEYAGEMVHCGNRRANFAVTPDHRMYVRKWDEAKRTLSHNYQFVRAGEIGWYVGLMHAPAGFVGTELVEVEVEGDRRYDGDDFLAMLGLVISDGYAGGTDKTRNWVSFASFRDETLPVMRALAARVGFHECPGRAGVFIRYNAGALANWVRSNCYAGGLGSVNKRVPELVKCASGRQIKHFLHYFDDRNRSGLQFYSTSERLINDLQDLHLRIGKRSVVDAKAPKETPFDNSTGVIRSGPGYVLTVGAVDQLCIERKKHIGQDRYKGLVYCATVPNGTLITRRDGTVLISGNCWSHSTVGCVQAVRAINNQPYVPLSAYCVAATIKRGVNEGGWCGLSAKFLREKGVCSQAIWPQGDRNYRKYDTPEVWANAARHKVTEEWVDLTRNVYDVDLTMDQQATCLLGGVPYAGDHNWWSHSIIHCDLVEVESGSFGVRIRNSWGDSWGDKGFGILRGGKESADGAVAIRVSGASPV